MDPICSNLQQCTMNNNNKHVRRVSKQGLKDEITLRKFDIADTDDFMVWASDDKVSRFCSWHTYTDKSELLKYIVDSVLPHPYFRAICIANKPLGAILITRSPNANERCRVELGYMLASEHWGRGIVTRAVRMVLEGVFGEMEGLERVEALVDVENVGSQRVLEKAGFVKEGVLRKYWVLKGTARDMVMFSFLRSDSRVE